MQNPIQNSLPTEISTLIFSYVEKTEANRVCIAWYEAIAAIRTPRLVKTLKRFNQTRLLMLGERPEQTILEGFETIEFLQIREEIRALDENPQKTLRTICERETNLNLYLLFRTVFGYHPVKPDGMLRKIYTFFGGSPIDENRLSDPKYLKRTIRLNQEGLSDRKMIDIYEDRLPQYCVSHYFFPRQFSLFKNVKSLKITIVSGKPFRLHLRSIPHHIFSFTQLQHLDMQFHDFPVVPESLGNLVQLRSLQLNSNKIERLPPTLSNLTNLQHLTLEGNKLSSLPEEIGALKELAVVWLSDNQIEGLPEEMGGCGKLKFLKLRDNKLKAIPESFTHLTELVCIDLWNNPISSLPDPLLSLKSPEYITLDIDRNELPDELRERVREKADRVFNEDRTYEWWDYKVYEEGDSP